MTELACSLLEAAMVPRQRRSYNRTLFLLFLFHPLSYSAGLPRGACVSIIVHRRITLLKVSASFIFFGQSLFFFSSSSFFLLIYPMPISPQRVNKRSAKKKKRKEKEYTLFSPNRYIIENKLPMILACHLCKIHQCMQISRIVAFFSRFRV